MRTEIVGVAGAGSWDTVPGTTNHWAIGGSGRYEPIVGFCWDFLPEGESVGYSGVSRTEQEARSLVERLVNGKARFTDVG